MRRFEFDNAAQRKVRDLVLGPGLYGPFALDGRYVYIDKGKLATILQKQFAVDTIVQGHDGAAVCIEEKIVRWPGYTYDAVTLETRSCTVPGHESDGWMVYGRADLLHYAMCQANGAVLSYLIDFPKLQAAFWPEVATFQETISSQNNRTACRIVPLVWVAARIGRPFRRLIMATPEGCAAVMAYNAGHYRRTKVMA